jgi:signal peptidase I
LIAIVGALVALAVVGSVGWRMAGGSLFTIATPSMCPDLCVGTLVLDQPVHGPVHVGEVVTFRPPGTGTVYTHRVVRVLADGSFKTAGDALGKVDPWTVPPSNVIGRVVFHVRGLGWLWRFLPWMAAALACIVIGRRSIPGRLRKECDLLAITMLAVLPILLMRPLLRASVISWHLRHGGAVVMTVVNDGLLPAQFRVTGGPGASHLAPGQIVTMVGTTQPGGLVTVRQLASFSWWEWALVAFVVLLPMVGLLAGLLWRRVRPPRLGLAPAVAPAAVAAAAAPQWYQPVAGGPGRYAAPMAQAPPWPPPGQPLR